MSDALFLFGIVVYFVIAYLVTRLIIKYTKSLYWLLRVLSRSFTYSLLFGIGAIGGGGDPGFALPAPIIFAACYSDQAQIIHNSIIPFVMWWSLWFFVLAAVRMLQQIRLRRRHTSN